MITKGFFRNAGGGKNMLLYYIRHGDPIYNPDSLTGLGHKQSEALSKRLADSGIEAVYCSPSNRARQTAEPFCNLVGIEPVILDWMNESYVYRDLSVEREPGKRTWAFNFEPMKRIFNSPEVRALGDRWYTHPLFAKTNFAQGVARVERETDALLLSLGYRHDREGHRYIVEEPNEKRIAIFAHQGFGLAFLSALLDIPYNEYCLRFDIGHTGMTVINFEAKEGICIPRVLQHSNDSHLYKEGLGTKYHNTIPI